jgi:uncharacterized protein (TIGR00369 family)
VSDEERFDRDQILARIDQVVSGAIPHNRALGLRAIDCGPGWATLRLPYKEELIGNPDTGVLHGGAITSLVDATAGMAVFMKLLSPTRIATLDLRIDYLRPATPGQDVVARADCYKLTRQVAFVRALAYHEDPADPIASSASTFMIFAEGRSPMAESLRRKDKTP